MPSPANVATIAPSARNGPNGTAVLRPSCAPFSAMIAAPATAPLTSATRIAGATAAPRNRPMTAASLTSPQPRPCARRDGAHPHPPGIRETRQQQQAPRAGGGDQPLGLARRVEHKSDDN